MAAAATKPYRIPTILNWNRKMVIVANFFFLRSTPPTGLIGFPNASEGGEAIGKSPR